jgi:sarcosine oxidase subunit delta
VVRPVGEAVTDAEWAQYLFYHDNPKGLVAERWCHVLGCRQWFNVVRDTVTHEILRVYRIGDPKPLLDRS